MPGSRALAVDEIPERAGLLIHARSLAYGHDSADWHLRP
jgi:hypothetical protein